VHPSRGSDRWVWHSGGKIVSRGNWKERTPPQSHFMRQESHVKSLRTECLRDCVTSVQRKSSYIIVSWKSSVRISAQRLTILTEVFMAFLSHSKQMLMILPQTGAQLLSSMSFLIQYSIMILSIILYFSILLHIFTIVKETPSFMQLYICFFICF
jgi:hypothetical protein